MLANAYPVDGTEMFQSVVDIGRDFSFPIDLSPARSREGNSEGQKSLDHFESVSPLVFRQRELFNILISEKRLIQRELRNKGKLMR